MARDQNVRALHVEGGTRGEEGWGGAVLRRAGTRDGEGTRAPHCQLMSRSHTPRLHVPLLAVMLVDVRQPLLSIPTSWIGEYGFSCKDVTCK